MQDCSHSITYALESLQSCIKPSICNTVSRLLLLWPLRLLDFMRRNENMFHMYEVNSLRQRQNSCHFPDNIIKCIFLNENVGISLKNLVKFVQKIQINNIPSLVKTMAWRRPGDKPLSEPMMINLLMHICVTLPQWVNFSSCTQQEVLNSLVWSKKRNLGGSY